MSWVSGIFIYILIWWVVLFAVLPWGSYPPENYQPGEQHGAPAKPRLKIKLFITTLIALAIYFIIHLSVEFEWFSFREFFKD